VFSSLLTDSYKIRTSGAGFWPSAPGASPSQWELSVEDVIARRRRAPSAATPGAQRGQGRAQFLVRESAIGEYSRARAPPPGRLALDSAGGITYHSGRFSRQRTNSAGLICSGYALGRGGRSVQNSQSWGSALRRSWRHGESDPVPSCQSTWRSLPPGPKDGGGAQEKNSRGGPTGLASPSRVDYPGRGEVPRLVVKSGRGESVEREKAREGPDRFRLKRGGTRSRGRAIQKGRGWTSVEYLKRWDGRQDWKLDGKKGHYRGPRPNIISMEPNAYLRAGNDTRASHEGVIFRGPAKGSWHSKGFETVDGPMGPCRQNCATACPRI